MNAVLEAIARSWWEWAEASCWQVALMVLLVGIAALAARRFSARFRYLLWLLVLVKIFTPPSLGVHWGIGHWGVRPVWTWAHGWAERGLAQQEEAPTLLNSAGPMESVAKGADGEVRASGMMGDGGSSEGERPLTGLREETGMTPARHFTPILALGVWLAGAMGFLGVILWRYRRMVRTLRGAAEVEEGPLRIALERLALRLQVGNPPTLLLSDHVLSPFLMGVVRPRIVLPAGLPGALAPEELEDVLVHELMHWRRRDLVVGWIQVLAQALFWFHPLVWWANAELRHERECACDEALLELDCVQPRRYGRALLQVLLAAGGRSSATPGFLGIFERNTRLQRRLEEIMNQEQEKRRLSAWGRLLALLFMLVCLPMAPGTLELQAASVNASGAGGGKVDEGTLAREAQQALQRGDLVEAVDKEMQRVMLRAGNGNPWKDKIGLDSIYQDYIKAKRPDGATLAAQFQEVEDYLKQHKANPEYGWRVRELLSIMAVDLKEPEQAGRLLDEALAAYPKTIYDTPSKESRYHHLASERAGLIWDAKGAEAAEADFLKRLETDPKCEYFFSFWWEAQYRKRNQTDRYEPMLKKAWKAYKTREANFPEKRAQIEQYLAEPHFKNAADPSFKPERSTGSAASNDENAPERWLQDTYIITFKGKAPYSPKTAAELLAPFNAQHPRGIKSHHFRIERMGSDLIGEICIDGEAGKEAVAAMLGKNEKLELVSTVKATPEMFRQHVAKGQPPLEDAAAGKPTPAPAPSAAAAAVAAAIGGEPHIVNTSPAVGAKGIDPATGEITVTFDRDMDTRGFSWTGGGPLFPPIPNGKRPFWRDKRTCVMPVKLERAHFYRVGINAQSFHGFHSVEGVAVKPGVIHFSTVGASEVVQQQSEAPVIVKMEPANGAKDVAPNLKELRVTFSVPMGGGCSWCGGGENFPEIPKGARASWTPDRKTCILPVQLKSNWQYRLGLNSPSFKNFQSAAGVPLKPIIYRFETGQ